jgi:tetratricopeptide (TPR) repeat protein
MKAPLAPALGTIAVLFAGVIGLQAARDEPLPVSEGPGILYLRSPELVKRVVLSYDALAADVYWIRAVQHYGRTKLAPGTTKHYDLLYPLLDLTTSLDPDFNLAYRFGAIFLAEADPGGAGRPEQAIALLQKGLAAQPGRWEFAQDIGFVYYWWLRDYGHAAEWFRKAAAVSGAPNWMTPLAAVTEAEGGNRASSRTLWREIRASSTEEWLRAQAEFRLAQLDALDQIDELERRVRSYRDRAGGWPGSWNDLGRAGLLR